MDENKPGFAVLVVYDDAGGKKRLNLGPGYKTGEANTLFSLWVAEQERAAKRFWVGRGSSWERGFPLLFVSLPAELPEPTWTRDRMGGEKPPRAVPGCCSGLCQPSDVCGFVLEFLTDFVT